MIKIKKSAKKIQNLFSKNFINLFFALILILSILNIYNYLSPTKEVLGIQTTNMKGVFWYDFLQKHPHYIPGWVEIGRTDKVRDIDPNYL